MYNGKRVLAIVPARGGSKGVKLKNIRIVAGKPLIAHVADVLAQCSFVDRAVVSTDHEKIAEVSQSVGIDAPFRRPEALSGDIIGDIPVLQHALLASEEYYETLFDIVLMLQPTSPARQAVHICDAVEKLVQGSYDAVWSVSEVDIKHHPLKQLKLHGDTMSYVDARGAEIIARQQLEPTYIRNGVVYALTRDCLLQHGSLLGQRSGAIIIHDPIINIDTEEDLSVADKMLSRMKEMGTAERRLEC